MNQNIARKDYLYNLKLAFPESPYRSSRKSGKQKAAPAIPAFQDVPAASIADPYYLSPEAGLPPMLLLNDNKQQAMLVDKSLISFVSGVNAVNRADILESTLLAQLGAKARMKDDSDIIGWYKAYVEILSKTGWAIEGGDIQNFTAKANVTEIQSVIIDILTAAFGSGLAQIVIKALESIKTLADSTGKIEAFEKNTHTETSGSFQIGVATQEGGAVSINLGTFLIKSTKKITHILFVKLSHDETELQYASGKLTLDQDIYAGLRSLIRQKLNGRLTEFVSDIPI
jgi:hypothetical protein